MDPVADIFAAFDDSPKAIADATHIPIQTVCDWRRKGVANIPTWRRPVVLEAIKAAGKAVSPATLEYLGASSQQAAA
jgi:hypothetical protein